MKKKLMISTVEITFKSASPRAKMEKARFQNLECRSLSNHHPLMCAKDGETKTLKSRVKITFKSASPHAKME